MTDVAVSYHAVPPSQDYSSGISETTGVDSEYLDFARARISSDALARWTYFLLGCATLVPWNVLTSGTPFFLSRLADSPFYPTFSSYLSTIYSLIKLFALLHGTVTSKQSSPSRRIFVTVILLFLLVTSLCLSTFIQGTPILFFSFALFASASVGVTTGYLCAAVYARAALLGRSFLQSVLVGQIAIAIALSSVQVFSALISLWALPSEQRISAEITMQDDKDYLAEEMVARIFFGVSVILLGITLAAYTLLTKRTAYKSVIGALKRQNRAEDHTDELTGLVAVDEARISAKGDSRVYQVFKQNWSAMFSIAHVFTTTIAVYPAITVRVQSVNRSIPTVLFTAIHFFAFNVGELSGRHTCSFPRLVVRSTEKILALSLVRTLFIPLVLHCNVHIPATSNPLFLFSPTINSDTLYMLILFALGYTCGYVVCAAMHAVSSLERSPGHRPEDVDITASLGGAFMLVGTASGALCSFGIQAMI